jgi:hypothetical protein
VLSVAYPDLSPADVAARFAEARARGHPDWLWPDVPFAAWRACSLAIEAATRAVLTGERALLQPAPGATARALAVAAFTSGMGPLLAHWAEGGTIRTDADVAGLLAPHLEHGRDRTSAMEASARKAIALLGEAGAPVTVLKGLHTGPAYFPAPGTRPASDIDLLIPPTAAPAAERALQAARYACVMRERRPYKIEWLPPEAPRTLRSLDLTHRESPWTLEIHITLDRDFLGVKTVRLPVGDTEPHPLPGFGARVLTQPALLAFLALHASHELHRLPLLRLVEMVFVARAGAAAGTLDWSALLDLLDRGGGARFAFPSLALADRLVPGTVPPAVLGHLARAAPRALLAAVERMRPGDLQRLDRWSLAERFMWAAGPLETARCAARLLLPTAQGRPLAELLGIYRRRLRRVVGHRESLKRRSA